MARERHRALERRRGRRRPHAARRHEHAEVAEAGGPGPVDQAQRRLRVGSDHGRGALCQRCGDRTLVPRLDLEQRQREPFPLLGQRPGSWRKPLPLGEGVLESREPPSGQPCLLAQGLALRVGPRARQERLGAQPLGKLEGGLAPQLQPLGAAAQPVERGGCALAAPGGGRELLLDPVALREQSFEPLIGALALERRRCPALLDLAEPLVNLSEVELGHAGAQAGDLPAQLLRPLGRGRLQRQRTQPRLHLGLEVSGALDLDLHPRELQLSAVAAALELPQAGGVFDQGPAFLGLDWRGSPRPCPG